MTDNERYAALREVIDDATARILEIADNVEITAGFLNDGGGNTLVSSDGSNMEDEEDEDGVPAGTDPVLYNDEP